MLPTYSNPAPLPQHKIPAPICAARPELVELYWAAWRFAWDHVVARQGVPRSPYMDEGFDPEALWIWDTCFMALFCRYAPAAFPGVESLENFYRPLYNGTPSALHIHHLDNPPLLAWAELEHIRLTGDLDRAVRIVGEQRYLQQHFEFFARGATGAPIKGRMPIALRPHPLGFLWNGVSSGMDNTPRGRHGAAYDTEPHILWFDAVAQQALAARCIAELAALIGDHASADTFRAQQAQLGDLLNRHYWDAQDRIYYDLRADDPATHVRVRTPAAYWPLLAGVATQPQAQALAHHLRDPACFGGVVPWPSVARNDPDYQPHGKYWRGGVWVPLAYMSARALTMAGFDDIAAEAADRLLRHMFTTYATYAPHTIWEAYHPEQPRPATGKDGCSIVRPHFCGWSALGPIAMFIEQVLGFYEIDGVNRLVRWRRRTAGRVGITNLAFGPVVASIVGDEAGVTVESTHPFTLEIDGHPHPIRAPQQRIRLAPVS